MSMLKRVVGFACGVSAVAAVGFALAQGDPPDARIANPAMGAGQQSTFHTGMGETGLPPWSRPIPVGVIAKLPEPPPPVAVAPAPPPPVPVAQAPEPAPAPEPATMGAPPAKADRN